jgi:drug/metabolite transporter (DMT)-like permease
MLTGDAAWVIPAIISPAIYAAVSIGDKLLLSRAGLPVRSMYLFVGVTQLFIAAVILAVHGVPDASASTIFAAYGGGFLWGLALYGMFTGIQREEISRVTPVWQSSPIFAGILAVVFLGESVSWAGWLAILLVVGGAASISVRRGALGAGYVLSPVFWILIASAALVGGAQLLLKVSSEELDVWHNMAFRGIGLYCALGLQFTRPRHFRNLYLFVARRRAGLGLLATEGAGPFAGNLFLLLAIQNGPVSLVSALLGTRPIFVLAGTLLLALAVKGALDDKLARSDIVVKSASTAAIVAGIFIISLT